MSCLSNVREGGVFRHSTTCGSMAALGVIAMTSMTKGNRDRQGHCRCRIAPVAATQVFGQLRKQGAAEALQRELGNACVPLTLDVTDEGAVAGRGREGQKRVEWSNVRWPGQQCWLLV